MCVIGAPSMLNVQSFMLECAAECLSNSGITVMLCLQLQFVENQTWFTLFI